MTKRAAIILAGGKGQRFQTGPAKWQDKALAQLAGKPFLVHAIESVRGIVDETVVVVNENEDRQTQYRSVLSNYSLENTRIVTDLKVDHLSGPLVAILTGLQSTKADHCLTVPCDMPLLNPKVAEYLFNEIDDSVVAVPMWPNGRLETLLMVLERASALEIAHVLCGLGRAHPDDVIRGSLNALFVSPLGRIKALDPELKSFVNINSQEDLERLQPRPGQGSTVENTRLNLGTLPTEELEDLQKASAKAKGQDFFRASEVFSYSAESLEKKSLFFWAAVSREYEGKNLQLLPHQTDFECDVKDAFLKAALNYGLEAEIYEKNHCTVLAARAKADKAWCEAYVRG